MPSPASEHCPCGGNAYATCCGRYHQGAPAPTAETLMRSRYSAYVLKLEPYLLATWHPDTGPASLDLAYDNTQWLGLEIKRHITTSGTGAIVDFVVHYEVNGDVRRLHEISRFVQEHGQWRYVDGTFPDTDSV